MTNCDKIQTIGTALQDNLNDRGVSCIFGNTSGKQTLLDMANLINSNNLLGLGDSVISICASRPYLLSGEKTDLIVSLKNGVGQPLANKSVTVSDGTSSYSGITNSLGTFTVYDLTVSSNTLFTATYGSVFDSVTVYPCLLVDYGTTNKHTDIWNNMDTFTRATDGTTAYYQNTGSSTFQRKLSSNLSINNEDVAIEFELLNSTYCLLQVERRATGQSAQYNNYNYTNHNGKVHIEIKSTGTYYYLDNTLVSSNTAQLNQEAINFYVLTQSNKTTNFKYKDLRVYYL